MELSSFIDSSSAVANAFELRSRMGRDGYLFFRSLIDRDSILTVRHDILALCDEAGWLRDGTERMDGIADQTRICVEPSPEYMAVYNQVMKLESFHSLAHDSSLLAMLHELIGEEVLVHPRNITRIIFPQNEKYTTPPHQDFIHIQGTPDVYSAWIPLSDCPRSLGNLVVLAGSHRLGVLPTRPMLGAGGRGIDTESLGLEWAGGDFELGDALLFHSHTVHKALPNTDTDHLRLSVDFRYQGATQPLVESSLKPHFAQVTWDEVYAGWISDQYQYYWERLPLNLVPFDPDHYGRRNQ